MTERRVRYRCRRYLGVAATALTMTLSALLGGVAIVQGQDTQLAFRTVTASELAGMLAAKNFAFINVHIPYEGDIPQTDESIPFDRIGENLNLLPDDKDAAIVLYCRSGRMSEIAATDLAALGYTNVSHLDGGMVAWEKAGYTLQVSPAN